MGKGFYRTCKNTGWKNKDFSNGQPLFFFSAIAKIWKETRSHCLNENVNDICNFWRFSVFLGLLSVLFAFICFGSFTFSFRQCERVSFQLFTIVLKKRGGFPFKNIRIFSSSIFVHLMKSHSQLSFFFFFFFLWCQAKIVYGIVFYNSIKFDKQNFIFFFLKI